MFIWNQQQVLESDELFISKLKQRLEDQYLQSWHEAVDETSNHRLYKSLKTSFGMEKYLNCLEDNSLRIALSKIRLGSHNFMVERGKWGFPKLDFKDRICTTCKTIEDEYHCFIECSRFKHLRKGLPKELLSKPSMFDFLNILKTSNTFHIKAIALTSKCIRSEYEKYK